ncbi:peptidoglycan DD-metalloendopeptidase family protein (plasmid) [Pontibacillus sp. ALD_SL1]|uniref:stalk domain-containing protein n=1 Tax=Pontibacillus sp. ALD_SL1 TaxID=2777185 RepID=UPI001A95EF3E|nr:stalk domain-containing protein [Pontibacillus sp. ALD_SL1]QST02080.1 peptidoglycan DD-metalloendopeptidase family protein [Pontibacillus sp. ALD_SL1]
MGKEWRKVVVTSALTVCLLMESASAILVKVDNKSVEFPDQKPYVNADNRTMVPVRFISEGLGYDVKWDSKAKVVTVTNKERVMKLTINNKQYTINNKVSEMDTKPTLVGGRTFVPIRFVSEGFQSKVSYDAKTKEISIQKPVIKEQEVVQTEKEEVLYMRLVHTGDEHLNVRESASINAPILSKLETGRWVDVLQEEGEWRKIRSGSVVGYVHGDYLQPTYDGETVYYVQKGDYLYLIGEKINIDYQKLIDWNNLHTNELKTDQMLKTSQPTETEEPVVETPPVVDDAVMHPIYHTVKSGDTLYAISGLYQVSVDKLKEWNPGLTDVIQIGDEIAVSVSQFMHPAQGSYTSSFGPRWGVNHNGIDIAKSGTVPIVASADGVVRRSYESSSYGNVVFVQHDFDGKTYETLYAHMRNREVSVGEIVARGQLLGYMGNTGHSTGQHLHFEIHKDGLWNYEKSNVVDPMPYLER